METVRHDRCSALDVARGVAVILVVFMHACREMQSLYPAVAMYQWFNWVIASVRMPLLMLISGYLCHRYRFRSATETLNRALQLAWVYAIWFSVESALGLSTFGITDLIFPYSALWFVLALMIFTASIPLVRGVSPFIVLGGTVVLSLLCYSGTIQAQMTYDKIGRLAFFFYLALFYPQLVLRSLEPLTRRHAAVLVTLLLTLHLIDMWTARNVGWQVLGLPERVLACMIALAAAGQVSRLPVIGAVLPWLGRRTLPVFVGHIILLEWMIPVTMANPYWGPIVLTLTAVAGSLLFHRLAMRTGLRVLYERPAWLRLPARGTAPVTATATTTVATVGA